MSAQGQFATDKPVAVVRLEGTICDPETLTPLDGALDRLRNLHKEFFIVIVTPLTGQSGGTIIAGTWLIDHDCPYDELWAGSGIPESDAWFDSTAGLL